MSIAIKPPRAAQIRRLAAAGLDAADIIKLTGYPRSIVREAMSVRRPHLK